VPVCLTVTNAGIKEPERDREDHPEDPIEGVPRGRSTPAWHSRIGGPNPDSGVPFPRHKQHDPCVTVEWGTGRRFKCAEEQIQNEQNAHAVAAKVGSAECADAVTLV